VHVLNDQLPARKGSIVNLLLGKSRPAIVSDLVLLLARIGLGVVLVSHGWQKLNDQGVGATGDGFASMGIPLPDAAAYFATSVELVGGALLVVGLLTPVVGVLVFANMAGAAWYAHRGTEVFASAGGWELVAMIGLLAFALAVTGAGRISLDHVIASGRRPDVIRAEQPLAPTA
jgi:putative oxidoreductase